MRLIDADALKKSVPNTHVDIFENCGNCELLDDEQVEELIDNAPTIDAVPKWIPCEERLPEKEEKAYLVYLDNGHVCECRWWCLDPVFLKPTDNWRWHLMDKPQYTKVLAWMPLPEPYEGERKDDE